MDVAEDGWSDAAIGVCVLILALGLLIICLIAIVKLLHSLLQVQPLLIIISIAVPDSLTRYNTVLIHVHVHVQVYARIMG